MFYLIFQKFISNITPQIFIFGRFKAGEEEEEEKKAELGSLVQTLLFFYSFSIFLPLILVMSTSPIGWQIRRPIAGPYGHNEFYIIMILELGYDVGGVSMSISMI